MKIKELIIRKNNASKLDVAWKLTDGVQSSYELFLIQGGSIVERVKTSGASTGCSLRTIAEPMKEYALLLTVKSGQLLSSVRAGFYTGTDAAQYQSISYQAV